MRLGRGGIARVADRIRDGSQFLLQIGQRSIRRRDIIDGFDDGLGFAADIVEQRVDERERAQRAVPQRVQLVLGGRAFVGQNGLLLERGGVQRFQRLHILGQIQHELVQLFGDVLADAVGCARNLAGPGGKDFQAGAIAHLRGLQLRIEADEMDALRQVAHHERQVRRQPADRAELFKRAGGAGHRRGDLLAQRDENVEQDLHHAIGGSRQLFVFRQRQTTRIRIDEMIQRFFDARLDGFFRAGKIFADGLQLLGFEPAGLLQKSPGMLGIQMRLNLRERRAGVLQFLVDDVLILQADDHLLNFLIDGLAQLADVGFAGLIINQLLLQLVQRMINLRLLFRDAVPQTVRLGLQLVNDLIDRALDAAQLEKFGREQLADLVVQNFNFLGERAKHRLHVAAQRRGFDFEQRLDVFQRTDGALQFDLDVDQFVNALAILFEPLQNPPRLRMAVVEETQRRFHHVHRVEKQGRTAGAAGGGADKNFALPDKFPALPGQFFQRVAGQQKVFFQRRGNLRQPVGR